MSIVIDLPRPIEARIEREAQQAGVSPAKLVEDVLEQNFPIASGTEEQRVASVPGSALLQSWLDEARKPRTPEDLAEAEEDMLQLMKSLNATRREAGERIHFPDVEPD